MKKVIYLIAFIVAALLFEFAGTYAYKNSNENDGSLIVHYLDVWEGDSTFIELPNGKTILIDAGEAEYGDRVVKYIKNLGYSKIDYLFATHPHSDHIGGLKKVIKTFDIGSIYMPDVTSNSNFYLDLLKIIESKNKKVTTVKAGRTIISEDDIDLKVLAPIEDEYEEINDYSIVLKLTYKDKKFLFMADAEYESEMDLLDSKYDISADYLKVGHHGSTSSTNYYFLKKVSPKIGIISVGENNDYGHPKDKILEKLKNQGVKIYRTDLNGNIVIKTDGKYEKVSVQYGSNS